MARRRKDATGALFDGSKAGKRTQRVYTPRCVLDVLAELWPEGILCDPCSGPDALVDAMIRVMPPANGCRYVTKIPQVDETGAVVTRLDDKGDEVPVYIDAPPGLVCWPERTYLNPEFGDLEPWLRQFAESWECVVLSPARGHRKWYRAAMRGAAVADLNPIKFVGHDQTFPAPLVLAYRGDRRHVYEEAVARSGIGEVR